MKWVPIVSLVALAAVVVPCLLYLGNIISLDIVKTLALLGTIVWFASSPFWIGRDNAGADDVTADTGVI